MPAEYTKLPKYLNTFRLAVILVPGVFAGDLPAVRQWSRDNLYPNGLVHSIKHAMILKVSCPSTTGGLT
jgi:hypothetical protein